MLSKFKSFLKKTLQDPKETFIGKPLKALFNACPILKEKTNRDLLEEYVDHLRLEGDWFSIVFAYLMLLNLVSVLIGGGFPACFVVLLTTVLYILNTYSNS